MILYQKYIVNESPVQLNISLGLVEKVRLEIQHASFGNFDVIEEVLEDVYVMIYRDLYTRFVVSNKGGK